MTYLNLDIKKSVVLNQLTNAIRMVLQIILHPLLLPLYCIAYLLFVDKIYCIGLPEHTKKNIILTSVFNLLFFPLMSMLLLRGLGLINHWKSLVKKDKIIIAFTISIFYFWTFYLFRNQSIIPPILQRLAMSFFVLISLAPFFYFYQNSSLSLAVALTIFYRSCIELYARQEDVYFSIPFFVYSIFLVGVVLSLALYQHNLSEIKSSNTMAIATAVLTSIISVLFL